MQALGTIEVVGLAAGIEAADVACKAANVELVGYERHGRADRVKDVKAEIARVKKSAPSGRTTPNDSDTA